MTSPLTAPISTTVREHERVITDAELRTQLACAHAAAFGWALACCRGDRESAEEILHDVYVGVLEHRIAYSEHSAFTTWLFGVIRMTARSRRRRDWWRTMLLARNGNHVSPSPLRNVAELVEQDSRAAHLRDALAQLPARQREVLHLVFYQDLTVEAAAEIMNVSVGSARTHYARGKARLAKIIGVAEDL
jgi:RNA polymerase sigma factor (sigma-70 family)